MFNFDLFHIIGYIVDLAIIVFVWRLFFGRNKEK